MFGGTSLYTCVMISCAEYINNMDSRQISKDFVVEFLQLYRSQTCLWRIKDKNYSNRDIKRQAYALLIEKWREVDANATKDMVVRKIDSFRGSFRKELRKIEKNKKSGTGEHVYKPKLWYFHYLTFLLDQELPKKVISSVGQSDTEFSFFQDKILKDNENYREYEDDYTGCSISVSGVETSSSISTASTSTAKRKKRRHSENYDHNVKHVSVQLDNTDTSHDEFAIVGVNIANKLRKLPAETAIVVEKLITDVLFEAQLGNIDRYTRVNLVDSRPISDFSQQNDHENGLILLKQENE